MAGERYAELQISSLTPRGGDTLDIWLGGAYRRFTAVTASTGAANEFLVDTDYSNQSTSNNVRYANAMSLAIAIDGLLRTLALQDDYAVFADFVVSAGFGRIVVTARRYESTLNFEPLLTSAGAQWYEISRVTTIHPVLVEADVVIARCFDSATAAIGLEVSGGTDGVYSFLWSDGATTRDRAGLKAGLYVVTVTDTSGASTQLSIEVGQNTRIVLEMVKTATGLSVVASGGTAPYTFLWEDGATTPTRDNLSPGAYRCEVRDALGCGAAVTTNLDESRFYFSHDPIVLHLDAGDAYREDPSTKPDLSFICEVYVEHDYLSGQFELAGQAEEQPADRDGRTTFEVQELLDPFVSPTLPSLLEADRTRIQRAGSNFRRFYLRYRERFGGGLAATFTTEISYVLYGGLSFEEAARGTWFEGWFAFQRPFLTWEPTCKTVTRTQPEYLYYAVPSPGITTVQRRVRLLFADGTTQTVLDSAVAGVLRYEVYLVPCGYEALGLARYEAAGRRLRGWEVSIVDQEGAVVSEERTFLLSNRYQRTSRYFLYANSLGGFNTLPTHGRAELQLASKTTSSPLPRVAGYDPVRGDVEVDRKTGLPTLKVSAGARSAEQLLADQDFLLSPRVLLYDGDRLRAGVVKDRSASVLDEDATRRTLAFDFEMPRERHYTPRLTSPTTTILLPDAADDTP